MADDSDRVIAAARAALAHQREGGRRRARYRGERYQSNRYRPRRRGPGRILWIVLGVMLAAMIAGVVLTGLLLVAGLVLAGVAMAALLRPSRKTVAAAPPSADSLAKSALPALADHTRDWLDANARALPAPALPIAARLDARLETLAPVLAAMPEDHPAARPLRTLLGEHLPDLVRAYADVPEALRDTPHLGTTPNARLEAGLTHIADELDHALTDLAAGPLDRLAVQERFLEYRYGEGPKPEA